MKLLQIFNAIDKDNDIHHKISIILSLLTLYKHGIITDCGSNNASVYICVLVSCSQLLPLGKGCKYSSQENYNFKVGVCPPTS